MGYNRYTFFVGGLPSDVEQFMEKLNEQDGIHELNFFEMLADKYVVVPAAINPFLEIKDAYLRHNSFFIKLRQGQLSNQVLGQLLSVLQRTIGAGGAFFVIIEQTPLEDSWSSEIGESVDIWYAMDAEDSHDTVDETVKMQSVV